MASCRTTSPPKDTATWRRLASRPTLACWVEWCTASSAQSCTVTMVSSAPSPTTISTFSRQRRRALEPQHDGRLGERAGADHQVAGRGDLVAGAGHGDRGGRVGRVADVLGGHVDEEHRLGGLPGTRADAVGRHQAELPPGLVVGADPLDASRRARADLDLEGVAVESRVLVDAAEPLERREPPDLLAAGGHRWSATSKDPSGCRWLSTFSGSFERVAHRISNSHSHCRFTFGWTEPARSAHADEPSGGRARRMASAALSRQRLPSAARSGG